MSRPPMHPLECDACGRLARRGEPIRMVTSEVLGAMVSSFLSLPPTLTFCSKFCADAWTDCHLNDDGPPSGGSGA